MTHPSIKWATNIARNLGSTANMARGLVRAIRGKCHALPREKSDLMDRRAAVRQPIGTVPIAPNVWTTLSDDALAEDARASARKKHPNRSNWQLPEASADPKKHASVLIINCGRYSSRCTYTRLEYRPLYHSAFCVSASGRSISIARGGTIVARQIEGGGRSFGADEIGPYVERRGVRYHPTPEEWRLPSREFSGVANRGLEAASRAERDGKKMQRDLRGVGITIHDSARAGNCAYGTMRYAESIGVPREYALAGYPVSARKMDFGNPRVVAAAKQALMRETLVCI